MPAVTPHEVTIGIITALPVEGAAVLRVLEDATSFSHPQDQNGYHVGQVPSGTPGRSHSVAVLMMPRDGTRLAATCCANMLRTFPNIQTVIMVGIAGGIPRPEQPERHVRLGDIVVATDGIVDYGHIRETDTGPVLRGRQGSGLLTPRLLHAATLLRVGERGGNRPWETMLGKALPREFARPAPGTDILRVGERTVTHPPRPEPAPAGDMPRVHYGAIGSADVLMKSEQRRDALAAQYSDIFAVEMEGSGIAAATAACGRTWFMVRGVADYAATGKNDVWHAYASYAAAVWTRALLAVTPPLAEPQAMVTEAALPLVDQGRETEVVALLNRVPHDTDLRAVWAATVPDYPEPDPSLFTSAPAVYHYLARLNARPDVPHPAFRFADRLGHALSGEHGRALRDWAARQAGPATEPVRAAPGPADAHDGKVRPSLTLQITVDGLDRDLCRITPFLQAASGSWQPAPGPGEPVVTTVDGLARETAKLVAEAEMRWQGVADRADIEFMLPTGLLNMAVQWFSGPEILDEARPLCMEYSVSLRSLERMRELRIHRAWSHRWRQLDRKPFSGRVLWGRGSAEPDDMGDWRRELDGDTSYLVVVLSGPPGTETGDAELRAALRAGVPIVLWDQRAPRPEDGTAGLRRLSAEPARLPESTRMARIEADRAPVDGPPHFGRTVALLWDDADRRISDQGAAG
ncbi:hypothetical protein Ait01nite_090240 [Actinoplanes italicus]|uniref:Nucleoside phosphorylase n=1 Tax=Actinoplanes italicus TaxID=113567 RepID=A0A2T0JDG5_9ACTN|nr:hypothetical protein [Actinoplanes italicus]PRX05539.1 nucleoside phosphorylase [Actinoplanes italicus]GIE35979.1 hypothetical protein Ait01nite_090240 [Actinoplanes italicus]